MTARRRIAASLAVAALAVALAGCSASPDEATARAEEAFAALVDAASATAPDAGLRTLETASPGERACGEDGEGVVAVYSATGTPPVTATELALARVADTVIAALDAEEWTAIEPAAGADQRAAEDEHGTVATVTVDGRILLIAVFTPCLAGG